MAIEHSRIKIVSPAGFDSGTAQTPGSVRLAAVAPQLGVQSAMWGGLFEVNPRARTGIHHHGEQQTIAYVLSGICEVRWGATGEYAARANAGDFIHVPAFLPHMEINPSEFGAFSLGSREKHLDADRGESSGRHVALSTVATPASAFARLHRARVQNNTGTSWDCHGS